MTLFYCAPLFPFSGVCYNEVECLVGGGRFSAYCQGSPPALSGVCCVFASNKCDGRKTRKRVSYFTNAKFPDVDKEPNSCQYRVEALPGTCWIRDAPGDRDRRRRISRLDSCHACSFNIGLSCWLGNST